MKEREKKCRPFTQLIHDSQFSAIGLVLLGELAKIRRILDEISADYVDNKNNNNNNGLDSMVGKMDTGGSAIDGNNQLTRRSGGKEQSSLEGEDVGERIQRQSSSKVEDSNDGGIIGPLKSKKTRKVHVNEIDQLFDGLA